MTRLALDGPGGGTWSIGTGDANAGRVLDAIRII